MIIITFQIAGEEVTHLHILQSGLANSELVQDCLAVAKVVQSLTGVFKVEK